MVGKVLSLLMCCTYCYAVPTVKDTLPSKSHLVLPEIQIKGNALVAKRRGDTLVIAADRFKRPDILRLEQLFSNVPGFQVDANGNISFNGRPIKKIMLDGDDLTAENYHLISRNLRSLIVDSIQVIENYNENRFLKNIQGYNDVAINLVLKQSYYGKPNTNITAAYAPKEHGEFQTEFIQLRSKRKQMAVANANNIGSRSLQQDPIEYKVLGNKNYPMFRSWPEALKNSFSSALAEKYVNQNGDLGFSIASTMKIDNYNRLRITLSNSTYLLTSNVAQDQLFSSVADQAVVLFTRLSQKRSVSLTNVILHWEKDKRNQKRTSYEFEGYNQKTNDINNEVRQLTSIHHLNASSRLSARGFRFKMDHTRKTIGNHIWQWEAILNGSVNRYQISINRNDLGLIDSTTYIISQFAKHSGVNAQTSFGHIKTTKRNIFRSWLRTSVLKIYSNQYQDKLELNILKSYVATHLTRTVSRKINLDMQSMLGYAQQTFNRNGISEFIYHVDQAFTWIPKATKQLRLNYGILKQEADASRFFAGAMYTNATLRVEGPTIISFPVTLYSQINFSLLDLYRGVNLYTQLMIRNVKRDYFMSTTLEPFYTSINHQVAEEQLSASFNFQLEKVIHVARLKYRLSYGSMYLKLPVQFNTQKFTAINIVKRIGQHISTNWRKGYNLQFDYQFVQSQFSGPLSDGLKNIQHDYKVTLELHFSRHLNAHVTVHHFRSRTIFPFDLVDLKMNWSPNSKYRIYINGNNLLNRKLFVQQILHVNSISTNQQYLIGRRIVVGADIPL